MERGPTVVSPCAPSAFTSNTQWALALVDEPLTAAALDGVL